MSALRSAGQGLLLSLCALGLLFAALELGMRVLDPFPYFDPADINHSEHGNLSRHDARLGWRGVAGGRGTLVTWNARTELTHNAFGFRDVEHPEEPPGRPAVVFLGDSFSWGYEVEARDLFVERLRARLPGFELFNLSHRGYGTDQSLLTFQDWSARHPGPIRLVVLLFSENDVAENAATFVHGKPKPRFELRGDSLALTGVPVPRVPDWDAPTRPAQPPDPVGLRVLRRSHLLSDLSLRLASLRGEPASPRDPPPLPGDLALTRALLTELGRSVAKRHAELLVVFIPSKREIEGHDASPPYQRRLLAVCDALALACLDLAPALQSSWRRTHHRIGMHWNARGHARAADALEARLREQGLLDPPTPESTR